MFLHVFIIIVVTISRPVVPKRRTFLCSKDSKCLQEALKYLYKAKTQISRILGFALLA